MKRQIIAPIHYLYDHPRDRLPERVQLSSNFFLTKFDSKTVDLVVKEFPQLYSQLEIDELRACRYSAVFEYIPTDKNATEDGQTKVHYLIESLRIVRPTRASCSTFVFNVQDDGTLISQAASQKSIPIYLVTGDATNSHFVTTDAATIIKYYKYIDSLYTKFAGSYNRVLNSFIFFQLGYMIHYQKLRIVPFVTALESLFNTSEQEVSYSLRIRCAAFLGQNKAERDNYVERIKEIYKVRSAAVHGSSLPTKILRDLEHGNNIMRDSEEICRKCFQKIIDKDLTHVFSQDRDALAKYLDAIVLS